MNIMEKPLWQPNAGSIEASNLFRFIHYVNDKEQLRLKDYLALYEWSITHPEQFWPALWEFCDVKASKKWNQVLIDKNKMPGAQWFEGAKLNFAENLLRFNNDKIAMILE